MISIGIGEIQKNTSLLSKLTEAVSVVDKRKKEIVATIYPANQTNVVSSLAGKYKNRVEKCDNLSRAKTEAMMIVVKEKYGKPN